MDHNDELLYFRMQLLQAEIKMQGMISENMNLTIQGKAPKYLSKDFDNIVEEYGIHHNAFPYLKG